MGVDWQRTEGKGLSSVTGGVRDHKAVEGPLGHRWKSYILLSPAEGGLGFSLERKVNDEKAGMHTGGRYTRYS